MTEFSCQDRAIYRGNQVTIFGKRYGHKEDITVGRMYDVKIGNRILRDIPEKHLSPVVEGYVSSGNGGAIPIYGTTKSE